MEPFKPNEKIYFLPDGMTKVFDGETQVPELQVPWVELFAEFRVPPRLL